MDNGSVFSLLTIPFSETFSKAPLLCAIKNLCSQLGSPLLSWAVLSPAGTQARTAKPSLRCQPLRGFSLPGPDLTFREWCQDLPAPPPSLCGPPAFTGCPLSPSPRAAGWKGSAGPSPSRKEPSLFYVRQRHQVVENFNVESQGFIVTLLLLFWIVMVT